ncbi:holo-ACP synthase [Bifidobacterium moukalabense]|uniref:holo-ACP synthase n=1 Tax=Bifidobacterium moukalabense TaxID=1333651 RepID=UPI0010F4A85D|nr:4'-phosphopantetheinyl transferase superfamily protein [Bifidobacterium moukalabense]
MLGLGHDVVDVRAFGEQLGSPGSRMRGLFSARELRQSAQRAKVKNDGEAVHLAARWAGKEAFLKAWCEALSFMSERDDVSFHPPYSIDTFPWPCVEILDDSHGVPHVVLPLEMWRKLSESLGSPQSHAIHISLSHDGPVASAVVHITTDRG